MSLTDWITLIAVLVALIAVVVEGLRVRRGQRHALAAQYIQRYWDIDDQPLLAVKGSESHRRHRHRYLRLCEDEFAAVRAGSLDTEMWKEWHSWLAAPAQRQLLEDDLLTVGDRAFSSMSALVCAVRTATCGPSVRRCRSSGPTGLSSPSRLGSGPSRPEWRSDCDPGPGRFFRSGGEPSTDDTHRAGSRDAKIAVPAVR